MTDKRDINALRYYVERLEDELAEEERQHAETTLKLEKAREHIFNQALDIATLGQEVGRLRQALKKIATIQGGGDCCSVYEWFVYAKRIARAALAEQEPKT